MLNNHQLLIHGAPFGSWELPSSDSLIKAAEHVREALAIVAYMRARERAGTFISPGNSVPLERQSAMLFPFLGRAASGSGNQSTIHIDTLQGAALETLHGDGQTSDGIHCVSIAKERAALPQRGRSKSPHSAAYNLHATVGSRQRLVHYVCEAQVIP